MKTKGSKKISEKNSDEGYITNENPRVFVSYEPDFNVNFSNYKDVAINLEFNPKHVESIFFQIFGGMTTIKYGFIDDPKIENYSEYLEYIKKLWIDKNFYDEISEMLKLHKVNISEGNLCLTLLSLKRFDYLNKLRHNSNNSIRGKEQEFARFIKFLGKNMASENLIHKIEMVKGGVIETFDHGDYILKTLLEIIQKHVKITDPVEYFTKYFFNELPKSITVNEKTIPIMGDSKYLDAQFRKNCLQVLEIFFKDVKLIASKKYFLYNQLLAETKILDYKKILKGKKSEEGFKSDRDLAIDKIRKQLIY